MKGAELKAAIVTYLKSRGWIDERPGMLYSWRDPDPNGLGGYCWSAALEQALADEAIELAGQSSIGLGISAGVPRADGVVPEDGGAR